MQYCLGRTRWNRHSEASTEPISISISITTKLCDPDLLIPEIQYSINTEERNTFRNWELTGSISNQSALTHDLVIRSNLNRGINGSTREISPRRRCLSSDPGLKIEWIEDRSRDSAGIFVIEWSLRDHLGPD